VTDLLEEEASGPDQHPLDMVERFVVANAWACERLAENEIAVEIEGRWCSYRMWFGWEGELDALMLSCAFDLKVPKARLDEVYRLLAYINERLWVGHFDIFSEENVPTYRHAPGPRSAGTHRPDRCPTPPSPRPSGPRRPATRPRPPLRSAPGRPRAEPP